MKGEHNELEEKHVQTQRLRTSTRVFADIENDEAHGLASEDREKARDDLEWGKYKELRTIALGAFILALLTLGLMLMGF